MFPIITAIVIFTSATTTNGYPLPITTEANEPVPTCLISLPHDSSLEFVIDLHFSPKIDSVDRTAASRAECQPVSSSSSDDISDIFYDSIAKFIDSVTVNVTPSQTYSAIVDNGEKFYIRGKPTNIKPIFGTKSNKTDMTWPSDEIPNYKALMPQTTGLGNPNRPTNNSLGASTKIALLGRENGIPIVLTDAKQSTTAYTIIITDAWSQIHPSALTGDTSRTTVFAIGRRLQSHLSQLTYADIIQFANFVQLDCPQALSSVASAARYLACLVASL